MSRDDIDAEQQTISMLYAHLDALREQAVLRLREALRLPSGGTHQSRSERDSATTMYAEQIKQWDAAEHGLCFGRLDFDNGERHYIGRIGLFDDTNDFEPLLIDWRAPASRPFYLATAASPQGVHLRRHLRTRLRKVISLDDEVLDLTAAQDDAHPGLTSEAALLGALNAGRTGRMKDIVETIQAEQDKIIRSHLGGVLVVQGGPGTGKTAVALHRAAYLLYTHRQSLTRQGVLILGPNETFLRYISQVLPGLGETSVLLCTLGDLFPTVTARRSEPAEAAAVKGSLAMLEVLVNAVRDRQRVPDETIEIELTDEHAGFGYQRETLLLDPETCSRAREKARRSGLPHNLARPIFAEEITAALAQQAAEKQGHDPYADDPLGGGDAPGGILLDDGDIAEIRRDLRKDAALAATLDIYWPRLTPQQLLAELYTSSDMITVIRDFSARPADDTLTELPDHRDHWAELLRADPLKDGWTPADVPLLDEAAELLGEDETEAEALAKRLRQQQIAYAEGVLDITAGSVSTDVEVGEESEILLATDVLDASLLAERQIDDEYLTAAQRAAVDRHWTFGHVIVDEAQELSPMAWRLLMRRAPNRSMTVVGDVAQTGDLAGARSWAEVFEPYVATRWRLAELTVNYRTPAEIMDVAAEVLAQIDPAARPPQSVRRSGVHPERLVIDRAELADVIAAEASKLDGGRLGVIVAKNDSHEVDLENEVSVLTVRQAKGLEFDTVIVVDPDAIVAQSPRGHNDLYVALTRATQRLVLVTLRQDVHHR
ncbi:MAG TPA: helicase [Micromonosporaceae bacterium]|nr:helicase [Micromonosporaceae bacterium]